MTEPLRTDLTTATDRALHPEQHNEVNRRVIALEGTVDGLDAAALGAQPADADLTDIAGLAPPNDVVLQRKGGAWVSRTPAQLAADLPAVAAPAGPTFLSAFKWGVD